MHNNELFKICQQELFYFDCTNLYGWALMQPLPAYGYEWVPKEKIDDWNLLIKNQNYNIIHQLTNNELNYGYFIEYDMYCPEYLHDYYDHYPLMPELKKVDRNDFSAWQKICNVPITVNKLICDLKPKSHYVADIRKLNFDIKEG